MTVPQGPSGEIPGDGRLYERLRAQEATSVAGATDIRYFRTPHGALLRS